MNLLSRSIVLLKANNPLQKNFSNPFASLCNEIMLMSVINKVIGSTDKPSVNVANPTMPTFIFKDIIFKFLMGPARLVIQYNSALEDTNVLSKIFEDILIKTPEINSNSMSGIGVNFDFFVKKGENNIIPNLFWPVVANNLNEVNMNLSYSTEHANSLNLTMAHATQDKEVGYYFKANFHTNVNSGINMKKIVDKQEILLYDAKKLINILLEPKTC